MIADNEEGCKDLEEHTDIDKFAGVEGFCESNSLI